MNPQIYCSTGSGTILVSIRIVASLLSQKTSNLSYGMEHII